MIKSIRCAIYTRKSTDDGLEQDFNSLDNQYEICKNYIDLRKTMGLTIVPTRYDDGGFSGGNINRPAFQKLLRDVQAGLVDRVIIYKLDRLTRSTIDFAHIVELFDKHKIGFVSATEEMFDTSTYNGRFIVNVFMSFAQYEREIAGQRIRDKVANSKARGMWMGGIPPLGYDIDNRKLVINETEANIITQIYDKFIETNSVGAVVDYINYKNLKTKSYTCRSGKEIKGKNFYVHSVLHILKSPLYYGKVLHKQSLYSGQHDAIIEEDKWNLVQSIFVSNKGKNVQIRKMLTRKTEPSLLQGIIRCGCCDSAMSPTYTRKGTKEYSYYICSSFLKRDNLDCRIKRLPVKQIDNLVIKEILKIFKTREFLLKYLSIKTDANLSETLDLLDNIELVWSKLYDDERLKIIRELVKTVSVNDNKIDIIINKNNLLSVINELTNNNISLGVNYIVGDDFIISIPIKISKTASHTKIIETHDNIKTNGYRSEILLKKVAEAYKWRNRHTSNGDAKRIPKEDIKKLIRLNLLAPDIVEAILDGKAPIDLTYSSIVNNHIPLLWNEQRQLYGFNERI